MRVRDSGHGARFLFDAYAQQGIEGREAGQHFDGDNTIEAGITSPVDLPHATCADKLEKFVRTEARSGTVVS